MVDLVRRMLDKLIGEAKAGAVPIQKSLEQFFQRLDGAGPTLAAKTAAYVVTGEPAAILSTLATPAAQAEWRGQGTAHRLSHELGAVFGNGWRPQELSRLGEVMAALEPLGKGKVWQMFGTDASPGWLRYALCVHTIHNKAVCSFTQFEELATSNGAGTTALLDILFHANAVRYGSDNSLDAFPGAEAWLEMEAPLVLAGAGDLDAPGRVELIRAVGRFGLTAQYLGFLVTSGISSSKTVREAAIKALTGADRAALTSSLVGCYEHGGPGVRTELANLAFGALAAEARPLLEKWQEAETERRPREAIERALANLGLGQAPAAQTDSDAGYFALDGTMVKLPPRQPLPEPSMVPDVLFDLLRPAMASYNDGLAEVQANATKIYGANWAGRQQALNEQALQLFKAQVNGREKPKDNAPAPLHPIMWSNHLQKFDSTGVSAFMRSPEITLRHLVAMLTASSKQLGLLGVLHHVYGHEAGFELRRRIEAGADLRSIAALWQEAGGLSPVAEYLGVPWGISLDDIDPAILWPIVAESFESIDDALGLRPQTRERPFDPAHALELIGVLPKVPQRYLLPLINLATGTAKGLRAHARRLLTHAPGIEGPIARLLEDGRQEVRAGAADWLAARAAKAEIPRLRLALKSERSDTARAAIITALERLGDNVADCFDPGRLAIEAKAGLAKTPAKALEWFPLDLLPRLRWADGSDVDPKIVRWWVVLANKLKQPAGNASLDLWLDRLAAADASRFGLFVLRSWIEHDTRAVGEDEANAYAAANVDAVVASNQRVVQQSPNYAEYYPTDRDLVFSRLKNSTLGVYLGSAVDNKGLLALTTHVDGADIALAARAFLKNHGSRVSQCKALLDALAANPAPAAIQIVLATANRFKARTVQDHAAALIDTIAERRGWTTQELADRTIPTAGFDERGEAELDCGAERVYRLQLGDGEAVTLLNAAGTPVKTLPSARNEAEGPLLEAAKKHLAMAKKEVKLVVPAQTVRLREAMCLERRWPAADWQQFLLAHPIVGRLVRRLVWIGLDAAGNVVKSFRPLDDGSLSDHTDADVSMQEIAQVQIAHSSILPSADRTAWRTHLADYEVAPLFDQFGRDLPVLAPRQRGEKAIEDRKGWMIETFKLRGVATRLGYTRGAAGDGGFFTRYERRYDTAGLIVVIEFSGSPLPEENTAGVLFDMHFEKLRRGSGYGGAGLPLGEIPPVLLAESWQDLHDIAAAGTGFDAEWEHKTPW